MRLVDPIVLDRLLDSSERRTPAAEEVHLQTLERARGLDRRDRLILELIYRHHVPIRRVGELLDLDPGHVSRLARRLWRRLNDPLVRELLRPGLALPVSASGIATDHLLRGMSIRRIARTRGVPARRVRHELAYATGYLRAMACRRVGA